jgi:hypothetical protein
VTVIGLGAWCDYVTEDEERDRLGRLVPTDVVVRPNSEPRPAAWAPIDESAVEEALENFRRGLHFRVQEFADLADGRRLTLHDERGYSTSGPADPWSFQTVESVRADVLTTVLPDEDDGEEHPWKWLVELLRVQGVDASTDELKQVPYRVEFSERLRAKLQDALGDTVS